MLNTIRAASWSVLDLGPPPPQQHAENTQRAFSVIRFPIPHKRRDVQTLYSGARKSTRYVMSC